MAGPTRHFIYAVLSWSIINVLCPDRNLYFARESGTNNEGPELTFLPIAIS